MRKNVLFICTGNLCRSVIAEGILKKKLADRRIEDVFVHSAGVYALSGEPAAELAIKVAAQRDVDISGHVARQVTETMIEDADLVVAMESLHLDTCYAIFKDEQRKYRLLSQFDLKERSEEDVRDPYGRSFDVFMVIYEEIERCINGLLDYVTEQWELKPSAK